MQEILKGRECLLRVNIASVGAVQNAVKIDTHLISPSGVSTCISNGYDELAKTVEMIISGDLLNELGAYSIDMRLVFAGGAIVVPTFAFAEVVASVNSCDMYSIVDITIQAGEVEPDTPTPTINVVGREEFEVLSAEVRTAIIEAEKATEDANKATENATQAGAEAVRIATESAKQATTAKENAEQATEQANEATANANSAAQRANEEVENLKEKVDKNTFDEFHGRVEANLTILKDGLKYEHPELIKGKYYQLTQGIGGTVKDTPNENVGFGCVKTTVNKGDKILLTTIGGGNARAYAFTDKHLTIIEVSEPNTSLTNCILTAPENGYLYVNCKENGFDTFSIDVSNQLLDNIQVQLENLESYIIDSETWLSSNLLQGYFSLNKNVGEVAPITPYEHAKWKCCCIEVSSGQTIQLTTIGGEAGRAYAITDKNRIILSIAPSNTSLSDALIQITENGYLYVNCTKEGFDAFRLHSINSTINELGSRVAVLENNKESIPMMFNPTIDLQKPSLKVLDIGNSYTVDSQQYLPEIIAATGETCDISLYSAVRGGASFKTWHDCYNDEDTYDSYSVTLKYGEAINGIGGSTEGKDGSLFRTALQSVKWDIIIIHQVSSYANDFSVWEGNTDGGYLKEFIQILRKTNPQASIGFLLVHSYRSTYSANTEHSSLLRWENIMNATKKFKKNYGVDFIIPYGTAVQNLRASSLCDDNEFSTDGTHLAEGLGDYVASCCYYQSLIAPRIGVSVLGNTFRETSLDESIDGVKNITDETSNVAQKAAMLATYNMWKIMNPDEYNL